MRGRYLASMLEGSSDLRHVYDDTADDEEVLIVVDTPSGPPIGFPDARFARTLPRQPISRTRPDAPRVDARLVAVDVEVQETDRVWSVLEVVETFVAERPISALALDTDTETYVLRKYLKKRLRSLTYGAWTAIDTTIELNVTKSPPASQIPTYCGQHRQAVLNYMLKAFQGIHGVMTDQASGAPLEGTVTATCTASTSVPVPHLYKAVYTDPVAGDFHAVGGTLHLILDVNGYFE